MTPPDPASARGAIDWAGRLDELVFDSEALTGNPLGDPHRRPLYVYTPPGYDDEPERRYPSVYLIQGMTGQLDMWRNRKAFSPSVLESIDAWFARSAPTAGDRRLRRRLDQLRRLAVPRLARHRALPHVPVRRGRAVRRRALPDARRCGPSRHRRQEQRRLRRHGHADAAARPLRRPGHARRRRALRGLLPARVPAGGARAARRVRRLVSSASGRTSARARGSSKPGDAALRQRVGAWPPATRPMRTARSACRSTGTGRLIPEVWERWLAWDPVRMVAGHADALRGLRAIWIDAGTSDEYYLDLGAEAFRRRARGDRHRRAGRPLRAVRRHAWRDRVALSRGDRLAGGAARAVGGERRAWLARRSLCSGNVAARRPSNQTHAESPRHDLPT